MHRPVVQAVKACLLALPSPSMQQTMACLLDTVVQHEAPAQGCGQGSQAIVVVLQVGLQLLHLAFFQHQHCSLQGEGAALTQLPVVAHVKGQEQECTRTSVLQGAGQALIPPLQTTGDA